MCSVRRMYHLLQEQQGLYQRLRAAEERLLQADTDAATARHQLDADEQTEVLTWCYQHLVCRRHSS